ncbi:MAG: hypothetical protein WC657_09070 [Candidatus Paceibacterota bacterium]|jgi:hypothetical protein
MIVTRKNPPTKFEPITITLETETEATLMWGALNISICDFDAAAQRSGVNALSADGRFGRFGMFKAFNNVFDPTK